MTSKSFISRVNFLLAFICLQILFLNGSNAQELNKEVYVIRPYEPILTGANKISFLPEIEDISTTPVTFDYTISPKRIPGAFKLDPIKPARMVAVSMPRIYNSWLKLGLGNHATPLAEFNISNLRSREYAFGAYLYHKSSHSNISLANNDKVPGGYAYNNFSLYGKRFYNSAVLSADLYFRHHGFNYYGYNTELFTDFPDMKRDSIRQRTYLAGIQTGLASSHIDSSHLNYDVQFSYNYFTDRQGNTENIISVDADLNKSFNELQAGLDFTVDFFDLRTQGDTSANTILRIHPWISKRNMDWKFSLGFEAVYDINKIANFFVYPRAELEIIIVENVLVPFFGITGSLINGNYQQLTTENAFIKPGLKLKNYSRNIIAFGGIKGNISPAVRFRADVSYSVNKNMHFFVNDTTSQLQNQFIAEYDDVDLVVYHGQLTIQPSAVFELLLEGNYYDYNMVNLSKPWHKPDYEINISAFYRIREKISLNGEVLIMGPRYAKNKIWPDETQKLNPAFDFNLKFKYSLSKPLTVFFDMYNISGRSYQIWNQFPTQRFNFLGGISYKL